jgi:hypothetical protein
MLGGGFTTVGSYPGPQSGNYPEKEKWGGLAGWLFRETAAML